MGFVGFWCDKINPQFIWCRIGQYFFLFGMVLTKIRLQAHLDTLTESVPHFRLSYPNWNNNHDVFSRYGKNNWCLGRILCITFILLSNRHLTLTSVCRMTIASQFEQRRWDQIVAICLQVFNYSVFPHNHYVNNRSGSWPEAVTRESHPSTTRSEGWLGRCACTLTGYSRPSLRDR